MRNMKLSKLLIAGSLATLASMANAETFKFSYDLWSGGTTASLKHKVTGTFDGTRSLGTDYLVTNLSNVFVFVDDEAFHSNGSLKLGYYNARNIPTDEGSTHVGPVASFYGDKNNFLFSDAGMANNTGWTNTFSSNAVTPNGTTGFQFRTSTRQHPVSSFHEITVPTECSLGRCVQGHWILTPVPEPETYAMLLAGLGVMGAVARRRKAKQA